MAETNEIRRINLIGGACVGKSTTSAGVFSKMKKEGASIELVREYVKEWAYEGRRIRSYDQIYFFGKQIRKEIVVLNSDVETIITDSPIVLQVAYSATMLDEETVGALVTILKQYDKQYPCLNIMLDRGSKEYVESGRYQTYEEAVKMDGFIEDFMKKWEIPYVKLGYNDPTLYDKIMDMV